MSEVVYRAEVRIERVKGPGRTAHLPAESEPVVFGVRGAVAERYKVAPDVAEPRATTLDYIAVILDDPIELDHAKRKTDAREPSPAASYRSRAAGRSRCTSADGSMRAKTSPMS